MALTKVTVNSPLTVNATGTTNITSAFLKATGPAASKIQYQVVSAVPAIGAITRGGVPVTSFTQAEVDSNVIKYTSDPTNKTVISIKYKIRIIDTTDGSSELRDFEIKYSLPDGPPEGTVTDMYVKENSEQKISNGNINFTDLYDSPTAIFFRIQNWPTHGQILKNGSPLPMGPNSEFSMADIIAGRISYKHNGDEADLDILTFKARDTKNKWSGLNPGETATEASANVYVLKIHIQLTDLPIVVVPNGPLEVLQCDTGVIDDTLLVASDEDDPTLLITFKLTKLPLHGILKKNNTPMVIGTTWTNADIAAGRITFTQDCSDTPTDEFEFDVSHSKQTMPGNKFPIRLIPNLPPNVVINPLQVPKCDTGVPNESNLKITDPEGLTPPDLVMEITELPEHGMLRINGMTATVGTKFTYADVLAGNISYIHDCTTHDPLTDQIKFILRDGALKIPLTLPIEILVVNDSPPYMIQNDIHPCERNGEVSWKFDKFDFTDDDTTPDKVWWELTELPEYGQLFINGAPATVGTKFNRTQWETVTFRYVASSPDNSILEDFAYFKLYDENNVVEDLKIHIVFPPPPLVCPDITNIPLKTSYLQEKAISEFDLFASNEGVDPIEFVFTLTKKPEFGKLYLNGVEIAEKTGTWTSQDIKDMKLTYDHETDTPPSDKFEFSVTNGFCSVNGTYSLVFLPGLKLEINQELTVVQAGPEGLIDNTYLLATSGAVSNATEILYRLTSLPTYGKLKLGGTELNLPSGDAVSFTQADIDSGLLTYEANPDQTLSDKDLFKFRVSDSIEYIDAIFKIKIIMTDRPPEIVINELPVGELTCAEITTNHLNIRDNESTDSELVITILTNTIYGTLYNGSTALAEGSTFTYADIIAGNIIYCETVEGALLDSFDFSVTDSGDNVVTPLTFPIKIIPPPPPELINKGMNIDPCVTRAITPTVLNIKNLRSTYNKDTVVFTIKSLPTYGVLERNNVALAVGDTFTLNDIYANLVNYTGLTYLTNPDSFKFDVNSDVFTATNQTFNITFKQVNNPPWVCANTGMMVFELETKAITLNELQLCDVDLDSNTVTDEDPDSAEDLDTEAGWEVGNVMTPADTDSSGRAAKTVGLETPGAPMVLTFEVTSGSARAYIRDQGGMILASSTCQTASDGIKTFRFTPSITTSYVECQVVETCVTGPSPANWSFHIDKEGTA